MFNENTEMPNPLFTTVSEHRILKLHKTLLAPKIRFCAAKLILKSQSSVGIQSKEIYYSNMQYFPLH